MRLAFVEIANFRRLLSIRIDMHEQQTLLVGANNSGKTSAMLTLRYFLRRRPKFTINDFTLCHRAKIRDIGQHWLENAASQTPASPRIAEWAELLPTLDVWLDAPESDFHYVSHILPTIEWSGGNIGVRLRLEPKDTDELYRDFLESTAAAKLAKEQALALNGEAVSVTLWPTDLCHFLEQRLTKHFEIAAYILDPAKLQEPEKGIARCQPLPPDALPVKGDPFSGLIQVDEIPAQRGFGEETAGDADSPEDAARAPGGSSRKLAKQFKSYFLNHLDPYDKPDATDIMALQAIENAQKAYDSRLETSFSGPLKELKAIGYPGVADPSVKIRTRLRPTDGLDHDAAVQYEVAAMQGMAAALLPEDYNGLGYQNLISMVFKLMSFRDAWMRVAKAGTRAEVSSMPPIAPLQLVLLEEPEAHLHAQVQQVFIRKAYEVLRNHASLGSATQFTTQLIVSTHSSHLAHEVEFACLRYFKRLPAGYPDPADPAASVPVSTVINLTDSFGDEQESSRFAKRYLRATHCDLFFADAAILIEGAAERILLPHLLRLGFPYLDRCYITWLEVGGSHAHRLRSLIERLGLCTLIITDIDAGDPAQHNQSRRPEIGKGLVSNNTTLRKWLPREGNIDKLLTGTPKKVEEYGPLFAVRVAYQIPIKLEHSGMYAEITPYTFEDATVLENLSKVKVMTGGTLAKKFAAVINSAKDPEGLAQGLYEQIARGTKAEFALDLMELQTAPEALKCPSYVADGLAWLQDKLKSNDADILTSTTQAATSINAALNATRPIVDPTSVGDTNQATADGDTPS